MEAKKQYTIAGIIVEAVKSEGGGFYEVTHNGRIYRYLADAFETVAVPYNGPSDTTEVPE